MWRGAGIASLLLLAACAGGSGHTPAIPDPDTSAFQAPVAERIRAARDTVRSDPSSADSWGRLGEILFAHHLIGESVVCFHEAHRLDPQAFRWPYLASIAMIDVDTDEVLEMLRRAQRLRPDYRPVNVRLGEALLVMGDGEEARRFFEQATELDPEDSHALLGLGRVALDGGDLEAARELLEAAAQARPGHREVHAALIRVYRGLGLDDQAREAAARAARYPGATPLDDPVLDEVGELGASAVHLAAQGRTLLREGRLDEAIEVLRVANSERPDYFDVRVDLGCALILRGDEQEGIELLRQAEAEAPDQLDADELIEELRRR